ncbi:hypothetical protein BKA61DRAFT_688704 [Leptodontidium sp. MPI-SDFR-AT-0119]|nr:hypothetical protein BKA61DRAFT_688704 [Leptodontidium sp. MPI-SDFR-AT-0119]
MAWNDEGSDVDKVGGNIGAVVAGTGLRDDMPDELCGLWFPIADQATIDANYGVGFGEQKSAVEDMEWEKMEYSSFSPTTSSNASYDTQTALPRSDSAFSLQIQADNFNFQPFDDSIFDDALFMFKGDLPGFDTGMNSISKSGISPLPAQGFHSQHMELDMLDFQGNHLLSPPSKDKPLNPPTKSKSRSRNQPQSIPSFVPTHLKKYPQTNTPRTQGPRYHCPTANCTRSYKRQFELIRHQHVHTNVRVHECRFAGCQRNGNGKGFARKDHLKQHLKLVHGVNA